MPELPEVETLCRQLQTKICGKKILATKIYDDKLATIKNVRGQRVTAVEREGKRIVSYYLGAHPVIRNFRLYYRAAVANTGQGQPVHRVQQLSGSTRIFIKRIDR